MTGEGLGYDLGSMGFFVLLAFGLTVGIGYYAFRNKRQKKLANKNLL